MSGIVGRPVLGRSPVPGRLPPGRVVSPGPPVDGEPGRVVGRPPPRFGTLMEGAPPGRGEALPPPAPGRPPTLGLFCCGGLPPPGCAGRMPPLGRSGRFAPPVAPPAGRPGFDCGPPPPCGRVAGLATPPKLGALVCGLPAGRAAGRLPPPPPPPPPRAAPPPRLPPPPLPGPLPWPGAAEPSASSTATIATSAIRRLPVIMAASPALRSVRLTAGSGSWPASRPAPARP